ncbi:MAG: exodeoxyribonuclease VII large subunit [Myxococcales bacterium]|nr:exodeoxyribonuclease VII large subunit [Myxococcales bacterium]
MTEAAPSDKPERVLSVGELDRGLKLLLERRTEGVLVGGEVTALKEHPSGHAYFTLRDERGDASIDCVLYRSGPVRARKLLADGARIVVKGRVSFYAPRGRVQFIVESARPAGKGALLEALEKLKQKLLAEGLFAAERKRPLPREPRVIGVVTSAQGAALADIVRVAFRRGPARLVLAAAPVQGQGAGALLARALRLVTKHPEVDVVILGRGGGSTDDLMAFNEEDLVRAVASSPVPVVAAVGHEIDQTLVDLAADVRAATPSQAAELVVPDARARTAVLGHLVQRLTRAARRVVADRQQRVDDADADLRRLARGALGDRRVSLAKLERRLAARHPSAVLVAARAALGPLDRRLARAGRAILGEARDELRSLDTRLSPAMRARVARARVALAANAASLDALSPLAVLTRGYALVRTKDGRLVRAARSVAKDDALEIRVADGAIDVVVLGTRES